MQAVETAVLGTSINETRFQFFRSAVTTTPNSPDPAVLVLGSFNGGGAQTGVASNIQNNYELQNYTSMLRGTHSWRFGVRLRRQSLASVSPQNFSGTFTFGGGLAPVLDANNQEVLDASGQPVLAQINSIERYRRTLLFQQMGLSAAQIQALGGGATQFSIAAGQPGLSLSQNDVSAFAGDDWRFRPNITLSLGLRYETQSNIHDWRDWAPRLGIAWAPGGARNAKSKTVLRAGFGMFYDRFAINNTLMAERYNGVLEQQYVVANPDFYPVVPPHCLARRHALAAGGPGGQQHVPGALPDAVRIHRWSASCPPTPRSPSPIPIRTGCTSFGARISTHRCREPTIPACRAAGCFRWDFRARDS